MICRPIIKRRESELVAEALRFLNRIPGVVAWRTNVGAVTATHQGKRRFVRFGFPGLSDIIGWRATDREFSIGRVRFARFLAVELKTGTGKLTPQQVGFLELVNKSGGIGFVARSVEEIARELGIGNGANARISDQ